MVAKFPIRKVMEVAEMCWCVYYVNPCRGDSWIGRSVSQLHRDVGRLSRSRQAAPCKDGVELIGAGPASRWLAEDAKRRGTSICGPRVPWLFAKRGLFLGAATGIL